MTSYLLLAAISSKFFLLLTSFLKVSQLALVVFSWYHCRFSPDGTCDSQQFLFNILIQRFYFFYSTYLSSWERDFTYSFSKSTACNLVQKKICLQTLSTCVGQCMKDTLRTSWLGFMGDNKIGYKKRALWQAETQIVARVWSVRVPWISCVKTGCGVIGSSKKIVVKVVVRSDLI
jgi:hypothetical protein